MIERKLKVGEFLNVGATAPVRPRMVGEGEIQDGTEARSIEQSVWGFGPKKREVVTGTNAKIHRNFMWLPWADNAINYVETGGIDVLSGPFTGCYMILYTNGTKRVGHVATPGAKAAWNVLARKSGVVIHGGFKPTDLVRPELVKAKGNDAGLVVYGLVTNTDEYFVVCCQRQNHGGKNAAYQRIVMVEKAKSLGVDVLRNLP